MIYFTNYEKLHKKVKKNGRFTEFTGIIGELAACEEFGYEWDPQPGYDAFSKEEKRVQIKTRKVWADGTRSKTFLSGRISRFGRKEEYELDTGVLVLLGDDSRIVEVWKACMKHIKGFEEKPNQTDKRGRELGLHVNTFINKIQAKPTFNENYGAVERKLGWKQ